MSRTMNLTKRQREVLEEMRDGAHLHRYVPHTMAWLDGTQRWASYKTWTTLEELGLIESVGSDARDNEHFRLTPAGRKALEEAK